LARGNVVDHQAESDDGNTPLTEEELAGLIPTHLSTKAELNQWEALNIAQAHGVIARRRTQDVLSLDVLRDLHSRMFDRTWTWAGLYRRTDNNISPYPWANVPMLLHDLMDNAHARYDASDKTPEALDQVAARFHHELVRIHPWTNGNGRHARLATDLLLTQWGRPGFTWGSGADLVEAGGSRSVYIEALRRADEGDFGPLLEFVRS
jgi:Fic-DOC domain mobile mystery protein B